MDALPLINKLLERSSNNFDSVIYTLDWHPENHVSFYENCRDDDRVLQDADQKRVLKPFTTVRFVKPSYEQASGRKRKRANVYTLQYAFRLSIPRIAFAKRGARRFTRISYASTALITFTKAPMFTSTRIPGLWTIRAQSRKRRMQVELANAFLQNASS